MCTLFIGIYSMQVHTGTIEHVSHNESVYYQLLLLMVINFDRNLFQSSLAADT